MNGQSMLNHWLQALQLDTHFGRFLAASLLLWTVLFALLEPSSSTGLGGLARLLFWFAHAAAALSCLVVATALLTRIASNHRCNPWLLTLLAGALGGLLFAPFALLIEALFSLPADGDDGGGASLLGELASEFAETLPTLCVAWLFLNAPRLLRLNFADVVPPAPPAEAAPELKPEPELESAAAPPAPEPAPVVNNAFLACLPPALGSELIALSADLHYLHVYTEKGKTMLLYNLKDAVIALGDSGLQVHRSHWVAIDRVVQLQRRKQQMVCLMSNGLQIPVSRRRQRAVAELFGKDTKLTPAVHQ